MAKTQMTIDEGLMHYLHNTTSRQILNFKIPLELDQLCKQLLTFYAFEVSRRNLKFVQNQELEYYIEGISKFLINPGAHFGIMLTGNCGTGKTTMLLAIQQLIYHLDRMGIFKYEQNREARLNFPIVPAKKIVQELIKNPDKYMDKAILMIDDMGNEPTEVINYGMTYTPLIDLMENRYQKRQYTMISTNLQPKDFREKYGSRIADRFNEMMDVLEFDSNSYRSNLIALEV